MTRPSANPTTPPSPANRAAPPPPLPVGDRNANPDGMGLVALWKEDFATHHRHWASQGFWTLAVHRFGNRRMDVKPKLLRAPLTVLYRMAFKMCEVLCGIKLSYNVPVGRRVRLEHFGGMILGARSIGDGVVLRQNTTLGVAREDQLTAKPTLEDRVQVGAGAVIVGDITVGHDAIVGANAVVTRDVPPFAVVGGVPAKLIKMRDDAPPTTPA